MHTTAATACPDVPPDPARPAVHWWQAAPVRRSFMLAGFVLIYFALQVGSYLPISATYDEPVHLAAGYAAVAKGDYRIDPSHPPLVRMWAALPLLAMSEVEFREGARIDRRVPDLSLARQNTYAHSFIYGQPGVDADYLLNWGRFMIVILGALLGVMIFCWAEEWLGFPAAGLALLFYLLSPNLDAHAALVTTDLGVTCFFFGTTYFCWRTCRDYTAGNVAGLTACFVLAILSKFSAILLIPTGAVLLGLAARRGGAMTWRRACFLVLLLGAAAYAGVWMAYGFRFEPSATPGWLLRSQGHPEMAAHLPVLAPFLLWVDQHHLLPNAFTQGFLMCFAWSEMLPGYLAGEISTSGWWYYYPVAFLLKTPVAQLALVVAGAVLIWRRGRQESGTAVFICVPLAIYFGAAMSTSISLGLRHILPVYPFVTLLAAYAGQEVLQADWRWRTKCLVLGPLLGRWLFSFGMIYPHTLTYFNLVAGGPRQGANYLVDSNLDWGQHLKLLKAWMDRQGVEHINLAYFGMADPLYHGIHATLLPGVRDYLQVRMARPVLPGYVAISATVQGGPYLRPEWRLLYQGFEDLEPVAVIGHTVKVYWVEQWPEGDPSPAEEDLPRHGLLADRLRRLGWYDLALYHCDKILKRWPRDSRTHVRRALSLLDSGRPAEAMPSFRRAVTLAPENADYRGMYASALIQQLRFPEAIEQARKLVLLKPGQALTHDLLGIAFAGAGRLEDAAQEFRQALKLDPSNPNFREHLDRATRPRPAWAY